MLLTRILNPASGCWVPEDEGSVLCPSLVSLSLLVGVVWSGQCLVSPPPPLCCGRCRSQQHAGPCCVCAAAASVLGRARHLALHHPRLLLPLPASLLVNPRLSFQDICVSSRSRVTLAFTIPFDLCTCKNLLLEPAVCHLPLPSTLHSLVTVHHAFLSSCHESFPCLPVITQSTLAALGFLLSLSRGRCTVGPEVQQPVLCQAGGPCQGWSD